MAGTDSAWQARHERGTSQCPFSTYVETFVDEYQIIADSVADEIYGS
jgi:hypothetical protein